MSGAGGARYPKPGEVRSAPESFGHQVVARVRVVTFFHGLRGSRFRLAPAASEPSGAL